MSRPTLENVVRAVWRRMKPPPLPNGEVIDLYGVDNAVTFLDSFDGYVVKAWRHNPNEYGIAKKYQVESVFMPALPRHSPDSAIVDELYRHLSMLVLRLMPPFKPKGWRHLDRRPRCAA